MSEKRESTAQKAHKYLLPSLWGIGVIVLLLFLCELQDTILFHQWIQQSIKNKEIEMITPRSYSSCDQAIQQTHTTNTIQNGPRERPEDSVTPPIPEQSDMGFRQKRSQGYNTRILKYGTNMVINLLHQAGQELNHTDCWLCMKGPKYTGQMFPLVSFPEPSKMIEGQTQAIVKVSEGTYFNYYRCTRYDQRLSGCTKINPMIAQKLFQPILVSPLMSASLCIVKSHIKGTPEFYAGYQPSCSVNATYTENGFTITPLIKQNTTRCNYSELYQLIPDKYDMVLTGEEFRYISNSCTYPKIITETPGILLQVLMMHGASLNWPPPPGIHWKEHAGQPYFMSAQDIRYAPRALGTYWLCGDKAWEFLPPNWHGRCTLGYISYRGKRYWRMPKEGQMSSHEMGQRSFVNFFGILIPPLIIHLPPSKIKEFTKIMSTIDTHTALALREDDTELEHIRLMAMQNRLGLDYLVAKSSNLCKTLGLDYCCVHIEPFFQDTKTHILDGSDFPSWIPHSTKNALSVCFFMLFGLVLMCLVYKIVICLWKKKYSVKVRAPEEPPYAIMRRAPDRSPPSTEIYIPMKQLSHTIPEGPHEP